MPFDVFISYSTQDKAVANAACAALEAAGVRSWIAPRDVLPGADWGASIVEAINGCRVMILIFSSNADQSAQIRNEVVLAVNRGVPIVPVRIENVTPTKSLAYFIGGLHWLDALTPPIEAHLQRVVHATSALLKAAPVDTLTRSAESIINDTPQASNSKSIPASLTESTGSKTWQDFHRRGIAYHDRDEWDRAIAEFTEAIRMNSGQESLYSRANSYFSKYYKGTSTPKGQMENTIADCNASIKLKPTANALYLRGRAYKVEGDNAAAIADYTEALRIDPNFTAALRSRAFAYADQRDFDRALQDFDVVIRSEPTALNHHFLGTLFHDKGDYDRALDCFSEAIRLNPRLEAAILSRGNILFNRGAYDRVIENYDEALRSDQKKAIFLFKRGVAKRMRGDEQGAREDIAAAVAIDPNVGLD